jgi:hypothetical protein
MGKYAEPAETGAYSHIVNFKTYFNMMHLRLGLLVTFLKQSIQKCEYMFHLCTHFDALDVCPLCLAYSTSYEVYHLTREDKDKGWLREMNRLKSVMI